MDQRFPPNFPWGKAFKYKHLFFAILLIAKNIALAVSRPFRYIGSLWHIIVDQESMEVSPMNRIEMCLMKVHALPLSGGQGIRRAWPILILMAVVLGVAFTPASAAEAVNADKAQQIKADAQDPVLAFAREELRHWTRAVKAGNPAATLNFKLQVDPSLKPFTFAVASSAAGKGRVVTLSGATSDEVLQAAYTVLELMGYRFFVSGPVIPERLDFTALPTSPKVYAPTVERRGIRQHINFPMDISSYPLEEAKEYVRNLARLRYNWITFHSYPGHWTWDSYANLAAFGVYHQWVDKRFKPAQTDLTNGAFFYGDHFQIPNYAPVKDKIRFNKTIYCAPEVEKDYYTIKERGAIMTHWLAEVMKECKRAGMKVQLSTELRMADDEFNQGLVDRTLKDYPMIDALEFISREGGDAIPGDYDQYLAKQKAFMEEILNTPDGKAIDQKYRQEPKELNKQVKDLAYSIRLANLLRKNGWAKQHNLQLVVGNYAVDPSELKMVCKLASQYVPADVWYSLMPGHSSRVVADHFEASQIDKALLARTMIHSWIEFDGYMFLQQLAGSGVYKLIDQEQKILGGADKPVFGILYNHWRTTENFLSFRYTSLVSLDEKPTPEAFSADYAKTAGITDVDKFVKAMKEIDDLSDQRAIAGNIGFCIKGTWTIDPRQRTLACLWWWGKPEVEKATARFQQVKLDIESCLKDVKNPQYRKQLELLANRCQAAWCHLKAVRIMQDACVKMEEAPDHTKVMAKDLTPADKAKIVKLCDEADQYVRQYMKLVGQFMADRGVEGFLINYYYGPPMMIHNFKAVYGGQGEYIDVDTDGDTVPLPLTGSEIKQGLKADVKGN